MMPGRKYSSSNDYRYGFNGKEHDDKDGVVQYDYGFRIYDPRVARFKSVDPLTKSYPKLTPYQFASNCPIAGRDQDGLEFKLSITDPTFGSLFEAMLQSPTYISIYDMRKLTYDALHSKMSSERVDQLMSAQHYGGGSHNMDISGASATLTYDKDLPAGITIEYNIANYASTKGREYTQVFQKSVLIPKAGGNYPDANYPVDVRTINSPEYKDFYKDNDFVGSYTNKNVNLVNATVSESSFQGYLKGSGFVEYTSGSGGASINKPWGISVTSGGMWGSATERKGFYEPTILEGAGSQVGFGLSGKGFGGEGGKWYSWGSLADIADKTKMPTFSGGFGGLSVGLDMKNLFKKLPSPSSGASGGGNVSSSTLVPRRAPNARQ